MSVRVLPYGDAALLVEVDDTPAVLGYVDGLLARLEAEDEQDLVADLVPAARTVLVVAGADAGLLRLREVLESVEPAAQATAEATDTGATGDTEPDAGADEPDVVEIAVRYDGPDLADVAQHTGLSEAEVVAAHTGQTWRVAFGGFAPGFGYLVGTDDRLHVPRRDEARTAVPAGAVGLAGEFSGVYPRESPGGWQLIGTTDAVLWDLDRDPPALLSAGARVRFVDAGAGP